VFFSSKTQPLQEQFSLDQSQINVKIIRLVFWTFLVIVTYQFLAVSPHLQKQTAAPWDKLLDGL